MRLDEMYKTSAEQGNANAQYDLGIRYENGEGVIQDFKQAVKWYTKSAEQGDLGCMSLTGRVAK